MAELNSETRHEEALRRSEEQLRKSEEQFHLLVNSVEDYAIFMLDVHGKVSTWNLGAERIKGWKESEIIGKPYSTFFMREDRQKGKPAQILEYARTHGHFEEEGIRVRKDGTTFLASITLTAMKDDQGKLVGFAKVTKDITAHQRKENIERLATRLALAHTIGKISTFEWDMKKNIIEASPNHEALYGLPLGALQGRMDLWEKTLHPDDRERAVAYLQNAIQNKESIDFEFRVVWPDQSIHWIRAQGIVYYDAQGNPERSVGVNIDITKHKEAEERLQMQARVLDSMAEGVSLADENGIIQYTNPAEDKIFGYEPGELIGKHVSVQNTYTPEQNLHIVNDVIHQLKTKGSWSGEFSNRRKDGTPFVTAANITALEISGKTHYVCVQQDITEQKNKEIALRESEERFRMLAENIMVLAWIADESGGIVWYNKRWYEYTGTTPDQMEGWGWQSVHDPDVLPQVMKEWKHSIDTGKHFEMVFPLKGADGVFRPFLTQVTPIRDTTGKITNWFGTNTDISLQQEMERDLENSRDQLRVILRGIKDGITAVTPKGEFVYVNDAAARILGALSAEDVMSKNSREILDLFEVLNDDGTRADMASLPTRKAFKGETVTDVLMRFRVKATGEEHWSVVSAQPVFNKDGEVQFVINIFRNITDEKRYQKTLEENQRRLQFLAEVSATLTSSMDYQETLKNIATRMVPELADWSAIDILREDQTLERLAVVHVDPKKVELAYRIHKEFPYDPKAPTGVGKVLRTGEPEFMPHITGEMLKAAGVDKRRRDLIKELELHSYIIVPLIARGKILGAMSLVMAESRRQYTEQDKEFAEDVARRAAMAVDNARLYKDVQEALAMRDDFLSIASHELKTPVTSIKAFLQALEQRMGNPEKFDFAKNRQYMQLSVKQVDRLASIINDLLDINKIAQGRMQYNFKPLSIGPVLSDVIERMSVSLPTHKLHMKLEELTAKAMIDELRFEQVLTNLITNAAKYSPEGSTIDIVTRSNNESIYIDIIDRGIGISEEDQSMIFTRYYRTDEAIKSRVSGLGVGLFISHQLIRAHQGELTVKSHLGHGSTFTITLPRAT